MSYAYRIRRAADKEWRIDRRFGFGGWVRYCTTEHPVDAEDIARALATQADWDGTHQWFTSEDGPQCVRCGVRYRRGVPNCRGHHG